jgi:hypothetical protein
MRIQLAQPAHEPEMRRLHADTPLHGPVRIAEERAPDFFHALAVQGDTAQAIVWCDDRGVVAGMGTRSVKPAWIAGRPDRVGYLGALRVKPAFRKGLGLARSYQRLRQLHAADASCRFYLTTIMRANATARQLLTSGRAGLPCYLDAGELDCRALSPRRLARRCRPRRSMCVVPATRETLAELLGFLASEGSRTDFFPILSATDFGSPRLRNLVPEDFLLARDRTANTMLGALAIWDQSPFRQFRIDGYSRLGRLLRPCAGWLADLPLPPSGGTLPLRHAAFACVRDHDPAIFEALLQAAASHLPPGTLLSAGFPVRHPLHATLARIAGPAPPVRSRIYLVCWDDALAECRALLAAARPFHLDPATL